MKGKLALAAAILFLLSLIGLSVLLPPLLRLLDELHQVMRDARQALQALHNPGAANQSIQRINADLGRLQRWAEEATRMVERLLPQPPTR